MYDELVKRLRNFSTQAAPCKTCDMTEDGSCSDTLMKQAADAIEELSRAKEELAKQVAYWQAQLTKSMCGETLAELEKPRWIPVTERLPEDRRDVLVYAGVMFPYITVGYYDGLWKFSFNDEEIAGSADYWMPRPAPPKEET